MTIADNDRLLGIVLAGGKSTRLGQDKSQLPHPSGGTFLDAAVTRLQQICQPVCVSGQVAAESPHIVLADETPHQGPAAGIARSLEQAVAEGFAGCLVTPVDTPFLTVEDLQALVKVWSETGGLTIAKSDRMESLIGIYPVDDTDAIKQLAHSQDRSLYRWIEGRPHQLVALPPERCRNINRPEDLS